MGFKVTGPKGTGQVDKSKKAKRVDNVGGPSFESFLDETAATDAPESVSGSAGLGDVITALPVFIEEDEVIPQESHEHGVYLLEQLEELEKDILSATPSQTVEKLKQALALSPLDSASLTEKQKKILDALYLRAAIEVAKREKS